MRFDLDNAFGIHQQALLVRSKRAELIASNLANADTPGYQARDIDFKAVLKQAKSSGSSTVMKTTHPAHIQADQTIAGQPAEITYRTPLQPSVDGNTVDTQLEKASFSENALQYQTSVRFLSGKIKSLRSAIRGE